MIKYPEIEAQGYKFVTNHSREYRSLQEAVAGAKLLKDWCDTLPNVVKGSEVIMPNLKAYDISGHQILKSLAPVFMKLKPEIIERKSDMDKKEKLQKIITDCQNTLEKAQAELKQLEETTYSIGDRFEHRGEKYMLVKCEGGVAGSIFLVCLNDGNRWSSPEKVGNCFKITQAEFDKICGGNDFIRYWDNERRIETEIKASF
jgi:hypothetical protein